MWAARNPTLTCPASLAELALFIDGDLADPWGRPMLLLCGPTLPADARGLGVVSAGPDGQPETADDITSWQ